jgi:hypothetical protein
MEINKIKKADYNPRSMSKKTKDALKRSIDTFDDISGITVNKRTGNIVAGNHRWEEVCSKYGGQNKLKLNHIVREYFSLDTKTGVHTGFLVRIVDWDIDKEKAANIAANSDLIAGEFTPELQDILSELKDQFDKDLFSDLRLNELHIELDEFDEDLDLSDHLDRKRQKVQEKESSDKKKKADSEKLPDFYCIKITCPSDMSDEIKDDITEFLAKKKYYNKITIV